MTARGAALAFTTFMSGVVLLGLELAASRVLAPAFGNSLFVWGALIGVVLTGLSVGYWAGGVLADRLPSPRLLVAVGRTAGRLFSVSTAGSIAGTFATAFWLVPELGVDQLIAVGAAVLLLAALPLALTDRAWLLAGAGVGLAAVAAAVALSLGSDRGAAVSAAALRNYSPVYRTRADLLKNAPEPVLSGFKLLERRDTRYHHLLVVESEGVRYLRFDNSFQSAMRVARPYDAYFPYTNALAVAIGYRPSARVVLFIGLGAGSAPKRMHRDFPHVRMRVVEIDAAVVDVDTSGSRSRARSRSSCATAGSTSKRTRRATTSSTSTPTTRTRSRSISRRASSSRRCARG